MKVKAKRLFSSPVYGNVKEGDIINVSESVAAQLKDLGLVDIQETAKEKPAAKPTAKKNTKAK